MLIKLCEEIHLRDLRGICCDGYTQLIIPFFRSFIGTKQQETNALLSSTMKKDQANDGA